MWVKKNETPIRRGYRVYYLCECDCGSGVVKEVREDGIEGRGCGCKRKEKVAKHNLSNHKLYKVYGHMKSRCYNKKDKLYYRYGGRGIKVCDVWLEDISVFYEWCLANGWEDGLQIDRINNDGNYEPNNVRFVTQTENVRNRSNTLKIEIEGSVRAFADWCDLFGVDYKKAKNRFNQGMKGKEIFFKKKVIIEWEPI
ncbi:MAG: hypothetical protein ACRDDY_10815 [Clostridium sp.]|uniref:hypothetical protein n=1 Tax=Clostridium sp. TaxID=1506 RepID=UPI003EE817F0